MLAATSVELHIAESVEFVSICVLLGTAEGYGIIFDCW